MAFHLEFGRDAAGTQHKHLENFEAASVTLGEARVEATSIMKNIKFSGGMSNVCIIRDDEHRVVAEVRSNA
jgi:hypothetical protein